MPCSHCGSYICFRYISKQRSDQRHHGLVSSCFPPSPLYYALRQSVESSSKKTGRYKPVHLIGTALMTLGFGLFTLMNATSSPAQWIIFQIIFAAGAGMMLPTLLPAVQANLQESDTATATGTWNFIRSFGVIAGISIPTTIFNNQFDRTSSQIRNPVVRASLSHGRAYSHVSRDFIKSFPNPLRDEIIGAYSESMKLVWQFAISFAGLTFLFVFLEKEIKLRTDLETEYGRKEKTSKRPLATE